MVWETKDKNEDEETEKQSKYQLAKAKMLEQIKARQARDKHFLCLSITGNPKVGKTGLAMDCRTEEEIKEGYKILILDWDNGAEATYGSCWKGDNNIMIFNPEERNSDGTVNWDLTFENSHSFIQFAHEQIANGKVKAVVLDGADKVYEGASQALRKHLVKSQKRDGSVIHDTDSVRVSPLDWGIRNQINNRLVDSFLALQAHRILITHMKPVYDSIAVPTPVGEVPDWHKSTPAKFNQMLHIRKQKTGATTHYIAEMQASKTRPDLVSKEWVIFTTNGENIWHGIPEIRECNL
jgi:hypothetical protein